MNKHTWVDRAHKVIFDTPTAVAPPGCERFTDKRVPEGYSRRVDKMFMDSAPGNRTYLADTGMTDAQREIARAGIAAANAAARPQAMVSDAAGVLNLLDAGAGSQTLNDALGSCPKDTYELQRKVARCVIEASSATSDCGFDSAMSNLRAAGRQYSARGAITADAGQKDALERAGKAVQAYADGLQVQRNGRPAPASDAGGYAGYRKRISDAWKGAA